MAYEFDCFVKFIGSDIEGNQATVGGGIFGRESSLEIADCNAFDNESYLGAALYIDRGSALITDSLVQANNAKRPDEGVVAAAEVPTVIGQGGGLYAASADLNVRHSFFVNNRADISGGGLLLTGIVDTPANIFNTLFAHNLAGRDGAGASVNWSHLARFGNCTFADNQSTGYGTDILYPGSGGGLYCAYSSIVDVIDSIFWGNNAARALRLPWVRALSLTRGLRR